MTITATVEKKEMIKQEINLDLPFYSKSLYGMFLYRINKDRSITSVMASDDYFSIVTKFPDMSHYGREVIEASQGEPSTEQEFLAALEKVRAQMEKSMTA